jgi:hypothetical protein
MGLKQGADENAGPRPNASSGDDEAERLVAEDKMGDYEWRLEVGATPYPGVAASALHVLSHDACNTRLESQTRKCTACRVSTRTR